MYVVQWNATRARRARNGPRRETSDVRSHARLRSRSLCSISPTLVRNPISHFLEALTRIPLPSKKMTNTKQKSQWIRRERKIRMAPILGRLGAGAVFTTFIMIAFCSATLIGLSWGWELAQRDGRVGSFPRLQPAVASADRRKSPITSFKVQHELCVDGSVAPPDLNKIVNDKTVAFYTRVCDYM